MTGLAERRTVLFGALLSVVLGVALVQSSLLLLISAATMDPPAGLDAVARMRFDESSTAAVALLGVVLGVSTFLAAFIVSSTFAFAVNQRRRDLALRRLVGGSRGQLGRMLLGEAVLLGALGAVIGVPVGLGVAALQTPLIVLFGLVLGNAGASLSFTASGIGDLRAHTRADVVVEAAGPIDAAVRAVPGVATASTESSIPVTLGTGQGDDAETNTVEALVIDPAAYVVAHPGSAAIAGLHGRAVAGGPGGDVPSHGSVRVELPGRDLGSLPVVATVATAMSGGPGLLLPRDLVPAAVLATAPTRSLVTLAPGADPATVRSRLAALGTVSDLDGWLAADAEARNTTNNRIGLIVMGLGGLYALIGVVNSVAIGASTRRREFAAARVTGFTRGQVIRSALTESWAVTLCGLILGGLAAGATFVAVLTTTSAVTGTATLSLPWTLIGAVTGAAVVVTSAASVVTSWFATRAAPVGLLGAAE